MKGTAPNADESACQMKAAPAVFIALGSTKFGNIRGLQIRSDLIH
jgi:hypothetical protein